MSTAAEAVPGNAGACKIRSYRKARSCLLPLQAPDARAACSTLLFDGHSKLSLILLLQKPVMRTVYSRTAFQDSAGPAVRVSLDMQLHMLREEHPRQAGNWCRDIR